MDTSIFGLEASDLAGVVDALVPEDSVAAFDVAVSPITSTVYGNRGDKLVATFSYRTHSGSDGTAPVFVKRYCDPGPKCFALRPRLRWPDRASPRKRA